MITNYICRILGDLKEEEQKETYIYLAEPQQATELVTRKTLSNPVVLSLPNAETL